MGTTNAVMPSTRPILVILEPIALPSPIAGLPDQAAIPETSISGAEVPKPTMVRPMMRGEIPRLRAVAEAPITKRSAPQINRAKPIMMAAIEVSIFVDCINGCWADYRLKVEKFIHALIQTLTFWWIAIIDEITASLQVGLTDK